jgi:glutamyl-tRNA reductase
MPSGELRKMWIVSLVLVHRQPGQAAVPAGIPAWRTCLREVLFFHDEEAAALLGQPIVEGEAYQLLLEVICGLRSPLLGETQVMGQFKTFLGSLGKDQSALRRVGQRLLGEARAISERHLRQLGSRSYGSATRKRVADCQQVAVIGTGALAHELLKFLADGTRRVDQWGRRAPGGVTCPAGVTYRQLGDGAVGPLSSASTAVIVAAPVPSAVVDAVAGRYAGLCRVIDLRGERDLGPLDVAAPVVTLSELFTEIEAARRESVQHIEAARQGIGQFSREYELRDELHPFGWDDVCA